jgi:hypothetical protein
VSGPLELSPEESLRYSGGARAGPTGAYWSYLRFAPVRPARQERVRHSACHEQSNDCALPSPFQLKAVGAAAFAASDGGMNLLQGLWEAC